MSDPPIPLPDGFTRDADGTVRDRDRDVVTPFMVNGAFWAENPNDAYKVLQAHFLSLSRGSGPTLAGVDAAPFSGA